VIPETIWFQLTVTETAVELHSELGLWWGEEEFRRFVKTILFLKRTSESLLWKDEGSPGSLQEVELLN
jgi:hypothetical protein